MSYRHEINKAADDFARAVMTIANKKGVKAGNGMPLSDGDTKIFGYVSHIYDDPEDELYGTVDVIEGDWTYEDEEFVHTGVLLSALQNNNNGFLVIPSLFSRVVVSKTFLIPANAYVEYVEYASHVDHIQLKSHSTAMIGVVETEEFEEEVEDATPVEELKDTGYSATSSYTKDGIFHNVIANDDNVSISQTIDGVSIVAKDTKVNVGSDGAINIESGDSKVNITKDGSISVEGKKIEITGSDATIKSDKVKIDSKQISLGGGSQKMVLGDKLISHLQQLCTAISTMTVTCTAPGSPSSPPMNMAQFQSLSSLLQMDLSAYSKLD